MSKGTSREVPLTLEETLERVERKIRNLYHTHTNVDDLVQEAHISAWKDYQNGVEFSHLFVNAKYRVLNLVTDINQSHHWTGHIKIDRVLDTKSGAETRRQIAGYIDSYHRLHGHRPAPVEIAQHLGLTRQTIRAHLERLYLFSGPRLTSVTSLDAPPKYLDSDDDRSVADFVTYTSSFEDELINAIDTFRWLKESVPDERERTWTYLHVFMDYPHKEIGELYGSTKVAVGKVVRRTLTRLKEELHGKAD